MEPSTATLPSGLPAPNPHLPPPPPYKKHWDSAIKSFLRSVGLTQALRGFESDMLVLNSDWEGKRVPSALAQLVQDISVSAVVIKDKIPLLNLTRAFQISQMRASRHRIAHWTTASWIMSAFSRRPYRAHPPLFVFTTVRLRDPRSCTVRTDHEIYLPISRRESRA